MIRGAAVRGTVEGGCCSLKQLCGTHMANGPIKCPRRAAPSQTPAFVSKPACRISELQGWFCSKCSGLLFCNFLISNQQVVTVGNAWILTATEQILYQQMEIKTKWECSIQSSCRGTHKMCNESQRLVCML